MFRIAEIELGIENTIGITFETGVGSSERYMYYTFAEKLSFDTFFCVLIDWWCIRKNKQTKKKNPQPNKHKTKQTE